MRHILSMFSLVLVLGIAGAEESFSAKALFFGEDDPVVAVPTSQKKTARPIQRANIGASYFIRLKNLDGTTRDVLASRSFRSGERFQLGVKVNAPSYIYILNEDPNGKVSQIYPQPGHNNFVNAMGTVFLPSQGTFVFDNVPGTEQLLVYISPKPLNDGMSERVKNLRLDNIPTRSETPSSNCTPVETQALNWNGQQYASKAINFSDDSSCSSMESKSTGESYASKGIAYSDDAAPSAGGQVATYIVKTKSTPDTSLFLRIKLDHQ